jgi:hypothetical protein
LLPNGRVLVAGGCDFTSSLSSAELYDPATGAWTATGPLTHARYVHAAALLPSGKVLVAGGTTNYGNDSLPSAELYDPTSGTWAAIGPLTAPRWGHTATMLPTGKVLIAGGGYVSSAELYDPATGTWTVTGALTNARVQHTATLLPNGKILAAGGRPVGAGGFSSAELYDVGLGYSASWQPQIGTVTSPLSLGSSLALTGSGFRGVSEGSGGTCQDSPCDYPVAQLRGVESGQTLFLLSTNWSTNSFISLPVTRFPPGYALATLFVNGIPSTSSIVKISVPVPIPTTLTRPEMLINGSFQLAFTNSPGASFSVLSTTNPALPLNNWTVLGGVTEVSPGQFQFTDARTTNSPRFYLLRSE